MFAPAGEPWLWANQGLDDVAAGMIADEDGDLAHAFLVVDDGPLERGAGATDAARDCAPGGGRDPLPQCLPTRPPCSTWPLQPCVDRATPWARRSPALGAGSRPLSYRRA